MITSLLIAVSGIVGMMLVWVLVQSIWRRIFADEIEDPDVLAGRRDCGNCGCLGTCAVKGTGKSEIHSSKVISSWHN